MTTIASSRYEFVDRVRLNTPLVSRYDIKNVQKYHWENAVDELLDDVWKALALRSDGKATVLYQDGSSQRQPGTETRTNAAAELSFQSPALPSYTQPLPSYEDAVSDLPPGYETLDTLAHRRTGLLPVALPLQAEKSKSRSTYWSSDMLKDRKTDVDIDFGSVIGIREHKKKKSGANKKPVATSAPAQNTGGGSDDAGDEPPNGDGGDAGSGGGGDGGAGGGGDGGGGDDAWDDWATAGTKKKSKKQEEEEEAERKAKEEEEKKAAEASAAKNLSWADDTGGGDEGWAGFATVGKKKKGKVCYCWIGQFLRLFTEFDTG